uniref:Uncharacterized protein n=1 Tax=Picea glauca TaxID=3330 RepID=A0A101M0D0_PICGL|nr:hypothetical protein ABT39_MTgene4624 [Picea glauca]
MLESQKGFLKGPKRMKFLSTIGYAYFGTNESSVFALPLCVSSCLSLCILLPAQCVFPPPLLAPTGRIIDASDLELSVLVADPIPATERNGWKTRVQRSFYVCWTFILDGS